MGSWRTWSNRRRSDWMNDIDGKMVELCGVIQRRTTRAILFSDGIMEEWLPTSQVLDIRDTDGGLVEVEIPEWLAIERGLV